MRHLINKQLSLDIPFAWQTSLSLKPSSLSLDTATGQEVLRTHWPLTTQSGPFRHPWEARQSRAAILKKLCFINSQISNIYISLLVMPHIPAYVLNAKSHSSILHQCSSNMVHCANVQTRAVELMMTWSWHDSRTQTVCQTAQCYENENVQSHTTNCLQCVLHICINTQECCEAACVDDALPKPLVSSAVVSIMHTPPLLSDVFMPIQSHCRINQRVAWVMTCPRKKYKCQLA